MNAAHTNPTPADGRPSFADEMKARIADIEKRAKAAGSNMTQVCKASGIARATYERWMERPPQSVTKLDELEAAVAKLEAEKGAAH
jgi:hypothetical protein